MWQAISWIPLFPLTGFIALVALQLVHKREVNHALITTIGVGSVGLSALTTAYVAFAFWSDGSEPVSVYYGSWINTGGLDAGFGLYWDRLTAVMACVVTWVGFLIHLFSASYMREDKGYGKYFAYLNLFVAAMLILVMADNLLLLYLGWEGVGICSFLLIGFWYKKPENSAAATKAFIMTRIGDVSMALAIFLIFHYFNTLDINDVLGMVDNPVFSAGVPFTLICLLFLGGAVGKSAQLPLQNWLPDAMAGPTPVSALIHAATMVTAGVYLIARLQPMYELSVFASQVVAWVGLVTLLLGASSACVQTDIKRVLAYSTISQIGYMFLALGIGAYSAAIFHLMTHAVFKALLFLGAGYLILCLHEQQNMFKMGGLAKPLPLAFFSLLIGGASLAAVPMTPGYFSKHQIMEHAWAVTQGVNPFWMGAVAGSALTGFYTFRMIFVVFFGTAKGAEYQRLHSSGFSFPLLILSFFALFGGVILTRFITAFPVGGHEPGAWTVDGVIALLVPFAGIYLAYYLYISKAGQELYAKTPIAIQAIRRFLFSGWGFDRLYSALFVNPYKAMVRLNRADVIDRFFNGIAQSVGSIHRWVSLAHNGQLSWYAVGMVSGGILMVGWVIL